MLKSYHKVGSVYVPIERRRRRKPVEFEGSRFDHDFMASIVSGTAALLGIFALAFTLIMIM